MKYEFMNCRLNTATRELSVAGKVATLEPQVFDVLAVLLRNHDRIVSRDELIEQVWSGRIVSDATIDARISAARKAVGDSGKAQSAIKTIPRRGFRFVADLSVSEGVTGRSSAARPMQLGVQFCRSADGTRIAFGRAGSGPPLVRAGHWLTHLEYDRSCPIWQPYLNELSRTYTLVQYDQRCCGLSDWEVADLSLDAFVADLEIVAEAAGLDRFAIIGSSQGAPVAVAFAARYPERITHLVLHGGFVRGRLLRGGTVEREKAAAYRTLMQEGWGTPGSPFLQAFSSFLIPDATVQQLEALARQQRISTSAENAVRLRRAFDGFDVTDCLPGVTAPTLVLHARNDAVHPLQQGRELAAGISDAELVVLESRNHVMLPQEPAWLDFFQSLRRHVPCGPQ